MIVPSVAIHGLQQVKSVELKQTTVIVYHTKGLSFFVACVGFLEDFCFDKASVVRVMENESLHRDD